MTEHIRVETVFLMYCNHKVYTQTVTRVCLAITMQLCKSSPPDILGLQPNCIAAHNIIHTQLELYC